MNGKGAISSLLLGFVLGAVRFVLEVLDKTRHFDSAIVRGIVDINFLHYAIVMFIICSAVLIAVSYASPAPSREKLAGLTFATVAEKLDVTEIAGPKLARESALDFRLNLFQVFRLAHHL